MKKGKMIRSALAACLACVLAAAPLSAWAESADETELSADAKVVSAETEIAADIEEAVKDSAAELASGSREGYVWMEFGDALYNLAFERAGDISWLENVSFYGKVVPGKDALNAKLIFGLNDMDLVTVLCSLDPADGDLCLSVPGLFDKAVSVNLKDFAGSIASGEAASGSGMYGQMARMGSIIGSQIAVSLNDFFRSLPADVWQKEMVTYITPIMSAIEQERTSDVISVGDLAYDVDATVFDIPAEKMEGLISSLLDSLANDAVVEALFKSDAAKNIVTLLSMVSGGKVSFSPDEILNVYRSAVKSIAASDFSGIPGIRLAIQRSKDGKAYGIFLGEWKNRKLNDLFSFRSIVDGTENCFEIVQDDIYLKALGLRMSTVDVLGSGTVMGGMLNESIEVKVGRESFMTVEIEDLDLAAVREGITIGTIRIDLLGQLMEFVYGCEVDGTRTLTYKVNDDIFYDVQAWSGEAWDNDIEEADADNAVKIETVDDIVEWIKTFKADKLEELLETAGVPVKVPSGIPANIPFIGNLAG